MTDPNAKSQQDFFASLLRPKGEVQPPAGREPSVLVISKFRFGNNFIGVKKVQTYTESGEVITEEIRGLGELEGCGCVVGGDAVESVIGTCEHVDPRTQQPCGALLHKGNGRRICFGECRYPKCRRRVCRRHLGLIEQAEDGSLKRCFCVAHANWWSRSLWSK
jgi:hypothetical protein